MNMHVWISVVYPLSGRPERWWRWWCPVRTCTVVKPRPLTAPPPHPTPHPPPGSRHWGETCLTEPRRHATGVWLLLSQRVFSCVFSVFLFHWEELKEYIGLTTTNASFDHCRRHGTVSNKKEEKKKDTFKSFTCWPSPVKIFFFPPPM